jgi:hypothetical protein
MLRESQEATRAYQSCESQLPASASADKAQGERRGATARRRGGGRSGRPGSRRRRRGDRRDPGRWIVDGGRRLGSDDRRRCRGLGGSRRKHSLARPGGGTRTARRRRPRDRGIAQRRRGDRGTAARKGGRPTTGGRGSRSGPTEALPRPPGHEQRQAKRNSQHHEAEASPDERPPKRRGPGRASSSSSGTPIAPPEPL